MSDNPANSLVPVDFNQLPSTQIGTDEQFTELAKGGDYIGRLQLYTKSKVNQKGLIAPGHYGIPEGDDEIIDLEQAVDIIPLARRPKAIDMTDMEALVISYDMQSPEFQRIVAQSEAPNSHCQYGPSFLVFERSNRRFLEFFCGNKSSKIEAKKLYPFLPLTQADIDAKAAAGHDVSGLKPHGPLPVTLRVRLAENKFGTWHAPVVTKGAASSWEKLPSSDVFTREITRFLTVKDNGVEKIAEDADNPARAR
jgi:hypothetical protein